LLKRTLLGHIVYSLQLANSKIGEGEEDGDYGCSPQIYDGSNGTYKIA